MNAQQQEISDLNFLVDCLYEGSDLDPDEFRAGLVGEVGSGLQLLSSSLLQDKIKEEGVGTFKMCSPQEVQGYRKLTRYFEQAYEAVKNAHGNSNISDYLRILDQVKTILETVEFEDYVVEFAEDQICRLEDDVDSQRERVHRLAKHAVGEDGGPQDCEKLEKAVADLKNAYQDRTKAYLRFDEAKIWSQRYSK